MTIFHFTFAKFMKCLWFLKDFLQMTSCMYFVTIFHICWDHHWPDMISSLQWLIFCDRCQVDQVCHMRSLLTPVPPTQIFHLSVWPSEVPHCLPYMSPCHHLCSLHTSSPGTGGQWYLPSHATPHTHCSQSEEHLQLATLWVSFALLVLGKPEDPAGHQE